mgnify:CR=1 FL=1
MKIHYLDRDKYIEVRTELSLRDILGGTWGDRAIGRMIVYAISNITNKKEPHVVTDFNEFIKCVLKGEFCLMDYMHRNEFRIITILDLDAIFGERAVNKARKELN